MSPTSALSRRGFLRGSAGLAVAGALAACSNSRSAPAGPAAPPPAGALGDLISAKIDWKRFSGTTLTVAAVKHPWYEAMSPLLPQFTELTGITVQPSVLGEDQYVAKIAVQLSGGAATPDVFMVNQFGQAVGSGWLKPLDGYLADTSLTDPDWFGYDDFFPGARSFGQSKGTPYGMPITSEVEMLFVRSDLVPTAPATMADLQTAARAAKQGTVAGYGSRAVAAASETPWPFGGFVFTEGGVYLDQGGKPQLDAPPNVAALTAYADLLRTAGPEGVTSWGYLENNQAMASGRLALWTDSSSLLGGLKDPGKSQYASSIAIHPFPSLDGRSVPNVFYWVIGINAKSANADAAWLFTQWATSKPISQAAGLVGASPARASSWEAPDASKTIGQDNADRILAALQAADSRPMAQAWQDPNWAQISDIVARAVNSAVAGQSPAEALRDAQAKALAITG